MKKLVLAALLGALVLTGCQDKKVVAPTPTPTPVVTTSRPSVLLYPHLKACASVTCTLLVARDGITTQQGVLHAEVVAQPATPTFGVERPTYIAVWNDAGRLVFVTRRILASYVAADPARPTDGLQVDKAGRVFVPFAVGAHSSFLVVVDASTPVPQTYNSVPGNEGFGAFGSDTPGVAALDVDGDGIDEIDLPVNDYLPNYAEGHTVERYLSFKDGGWALLGCTQLSTSQPAYQGPKISVGSTDCKP